MAVRHWSAAPPDRALATTTPSTMSASTATQGRPRRRTDTVAAPSGRRRMERSTPTSRGGLRNAGTASPRRRAAWARLRAAAAKRRDVASIPAIIPTPSDILAGPYDPVVEEVPLNPAQADLLAQLRSVDEDDRAFDAELRVELRAELEARLAPVVASLPRTPLFVNKHLLSQVHGCEVRFVHEDAERGFAWTPALARGSVAHKAIELSMNLPGHPAPLVLVDEAVERLRESDRSLGEWLQTCSEADRAELRGEANDQVAKFLECWPPLKRAWRPVPESKVSADLCGDAVRLSGKVDLSIGAARGNVAGKVLIDLKTGMFSPSHVDDLRFYALVETLRLGTPPRRLATHYLDSGRLQPEDVTEDVLFAAVDRTAEGVARLVELHHDGREPVARTGPVCRWCPVLPTCEPGRRHLAEADLA